VATLSFDYVNKKITIDAPATSITVQELVNLIRTEEDRLDRTMKDDGWWILDAVGKESIGGGSISAIIMDITSRGWTIGFEARGSLTKCIISGGTVVASETVTFETANTHILVLSPVDGVGGTIDELAIDAVTAAVWAANAAANRPAASQGELLWRTFLSQFNANT